MSALSIQVPFPVFQDRDGQPLDNGYVWIGTANLYPITNPVVAYFDEALTIIAAQPLRTINGYISNAGTPAQVFIDGVNFSILVQDSKGSTVYSFPDGTGVIPDEFANNLANTSDPALGDALVGFRQSNASGNLVGSVGRTVHQKFQETVSVKDFGAVGNGTTNDTAAIQAAIDSTASSLAQKRVYFPAGNYLITGIVVYAFNLLDFDPNAVLLMSQDGIAIRTASTVGGTTATGNIRDITLINPNVNMQTNAGFGILFECVTRSHIENPFITQISTDNFNYTDSYSGTQTYTSTGILLKGITGVFGCFYNSIDNYRISGSGTTGGAGIWLGTSLTGNNQRPNFNQINFGTISDIATGIDIGIGGDNYIVQPEVSTASVGIRIGSNIFTTGALRTKIVKPYLELNSTAGIQVRANATNLLIEQIGSASGTPIVIDNAAGTEVIIADFMNGSYVVNFFDAATGGNNSPTNVNGFWTRSGSMVTVTFSASNIDTTGMTGGNNLYISLPFAPEYRATGSVVLENFTFPAGKTQANSFVGSADTRAQIYGSGTGTTANFFTIASISSGASDIVQFSLTYQCELPV